MRGELTRRKQQIPLRSDEIPSLNAIPPGCSFHPRCPFFVPGVCDVQIPPLERPPDFNQLAACIPLQQGQELTIHGR